MRLPVLPGGDNSRIDEEKAMRQIRYAIDKGVNYIDTAYPYHGTGFGGKGSSEPFLAKALAGGYREKVKIATKLPSWLVQTRQDMEKILSEQLERLETDHIDFYLIHGITATLWLVLQKAGYKEFLNDALAAGKIKYAGFSFHDHLALFKEIVDDYDWSFCMVQFNYMDEDYQAGIQGIRYARRKDLGIAVMEPLRGGRLAGEFPKAAARALVESGKTAPELALRWVWDHPEVSVLLSGMNTMDQVRENLAAADGAGPLDEKEQRAVGKIRAVFREKSKTSCTECGYCMPCPSGVDIPACFSMYNHYYMFDRKEPYAFRLSPAQRASNCSECGQCETHCPQGIPIRLELKKVQKIFERDE
jgi:predicted aldo/keto reductase-like oxidoreductase